MTRVEPRKVLVSLRGFDFCSLDSLQGRCGVMIRASVSVLFLAGKGAWERHRSAASSIVPSPASHCLCGKD